MTSLPFDRRAGMPATIRSHMGWLRTVALARLRDSEAVDEVLQNTMLAALDAERRGVKIERPESWLYRVLVRQCLLHRRRLGRQRKLLSRVQDEAKEGASSSSHATVSSADNPLTWLLRNERREHVQQALTSLPRGDAEVLMLKYVEGWSYQQIADHLGVSHGTVESRLFRARKKMRAKLTQADVAIDGAEERGTNS